MDLSNTPATRHDGWTAARKAQFLESLAHDGNVRAACARVGLSREAAYRLRRRDALFARAWAAAQLQARDNVGEVLGTRAIEGIEEEVWYRGEVVGTRRRYDTRLLLAHIARLDKLAEDGRATEGKSATKVEEQAPLSSNRRTASEGTRTARPAAVPRFAARGQASLRACSPSVVRPW